MARLLSGSGTIGGGASQAELDAFVGTSNITTLGTIGTGEWQGDTVAVNQGGTGATTHSANAVLLGAGTSAVTSAAPSSTGNLLTSNGTVWASAAPPASGITAPHDSLCKAWMHRSDTTIEEDFGIDGCLEPSGGVYNITLDTGTMDNAHWAVAGAAMMSSEYLRLERSVDDMTATTIGFRSFSLPYPYLQNAKEVYIICFGP